jgi:K+-sensing histidine kinase KdpD
LLNEQVLNGTIVMILVTCLISSFAVERASRKMALMEATEQDSADEDSGERILVPLSNPENVEPLLQLAVMAKDVQSRNPLFALTVTREDAQVEQGLTASRKLLEKAVKVAAATDHRVETLNRMDMNVTNGIVYAARENNITHLVIGWNPKPQVADKFFGSIMDNLLKRTEQAIMVYRGIQPLNTIRGALPHLRA